MNESESAEAKKPDKRKHERRACSGGAEIRTQPDKPGQWTVLSDLSLSGCYMQTATALPVKTQLHVRISAYETEILTTAVVSTCDPGVGMGVEFLQMSPEDKNRLQQVFNKL